MGLGIRYLCAINMGRESLLHALAHHLHVHPYPSDQAREEDIVVPPPIIKKEALEGLRMIHVLQKAGLLVQRKVDYNQKLNFSEDEGTVDEDTPTLRNTERKSDRRDRWEKDRGRDIARESEERREVSREPERESSMREKNPQGSRERDNRRDMAEDRRDRDRRFSPGDPERWQHRGGFDYRGGSGRDYGGPQNSGNRGCPPQHVQAHNSPHTVPASTSVHPTSRPPSLSPVHPPTHQLAHAIFVTIITPQGRRGFMA
ncbi:pre-mRNA-splicing factor spp2-like [Penaeus monodon]|uniref:pre-mRNA-splicing factor spp2-like n=1 Tax=Penaeus monodon TaxID=6687 RepID=UPI0018A79C72|nr:pre-mRNA-splicing factor spp2-like [Penaeus monodon]